MFLAVGRIIVLLKVENLLEILDVMMRRFEDGHWRKFLKLCRKLKTWQLLLFFNLPPLRLLSLFHFLLLLLLNIILLLLYDGRLLSQNPLQLQDVQYRRLDCRQLYIKCT